MDRKEYLRIKQQERRDKLVSLGFKKVALWIKPEFEAELKRIVKELHTTGE